MSAKLKTIESMYKSGVIDRYSYQDALSALRSEGSISDDDFRRLNNEAAIDGIIDNQ